MYTSRICVYSPVIYVWIHMYESGYRSLFNDPQMSYMWGEGLFVSIWKNTCMIYFSVIMTHEKTQWTSPCITDVYRFVLACIHNIHLTCLLQISVSRFVHLKISLTLNELSFNDARVSQQRPRLSPLWFNKWTWPIYRPLNLGSSHFYVHSLLLSRHTE